jgi:pyruvate/2-oxoglutarate dehydrogenase complex dihydrolipoamide dehydrogenase (E3) component
MSRIETDICIIGAGSGGLSVAAGAVQMGAKVVLIEGHKMGGDCLNYGCVPSKALLAAGHKAHETAEAAFGVAGHPPDPDFAAAKDHVTRVIETIEPVDSQERFEGPRRPCHPRDGPLHLRDGGAGRRPCHQGAPLRHRHRVPPLRAADPGAQGHAAPHQRDDLRPARAARSPDHHRWRSHRHGNGAGASPPRLEVTVLEGAKALGKDDPRPPLVLSKLRGEGIEIVEGAKVSAVSGKDGAVSVETEDGRSFAGSHLLVAVGRQVNVDKLDLEKAGVDYDRRGVTVDKGLRSTNKRVYAVGDAAGGLQFTHVAGYHAGVIIRPMLFGLPAKARTDHIPGPPTPTPNLRRSA